MWEAETKLQWSEKDEQRGCGRCMSGDSTNLTMKGKSQANILRMKQSRENLEWGGRNDRFRGLEGNPEVMESIKDRREWESIMGQKRRSRLMARPLEELAQAWKELECKWREGWSFRVFGDERTQVFWL